MSTLWRGFASLFFLVIGTSNQNAFASDALTGGIAKFEVGASSLDAAAHSRSSNASAQSGLSGSTTRSEAESKSAAKSAGDLKGSTASVVLQGGIEDGGSLNNSAKLIPDKASKPTLLKGETKQTNFPIGNVYEHVLPKQPVAQVPMIVPSTTVYTPHFIPPISSYGLSPRIGIITRPGYSTPSTQTIKGVTSYVPGFEVTQVKTNEHNFNNQTMRHTEAITSSGGVSTYVPGYSVDSIKDRYFGSIGLGHNVISSRRGVVAYVPGYETSTVPVTTYSTSRSSSSDTNIITTRSGISSYVPGFEATTATTTNTSSTWHPGQVEVVASADYTKNTLSGVWYSPSAVQTIPQLVAGTEALPVNREYAQPVNREYAQPVVADDHQGLKATAQILSKPKSSMGSDWDAWYDKIGRAIYSRWERAEVGPGSAKVRITIDQFRNMSCEVVGFRPAAFTEHDSISETAFRVTALRAVRDLSQYEIPELPPLAPHKYAVTFDLEMTRAINGPSGFIVAAPRN